MTEKIEGPEKPREVPISAHMERVELPEIFQDLNERITEDFSPEDSPWGERPTVQIVRGFEDVLGEPLGSGLLYNTGTTIYQLMTALSLSPHPAVRELLREQSASGQELIRAFRENQVLAGQKIIDLGSGGGELARALRTLGADARTADVQGTASEWHTVVDFTHEDAAETLLEATGGDFDLVTENIIGKVPRVRVEPPEPERVLGIGTVLLRSGGYLYYASRPYDYALMKKV